MSAIDLPEEAIQKYIERRKLDFEICRQALATNDFSTLARVGHQIKGNAITFGFEKLSDIAIDLESCALNKDVAGLHLVMDRLTAFLSQIG